LFASRYTMLAVFALVAFARADVSGRLPRRRRYDLSAEEIRRIKKREYNRPHFCPNGDSDCYSDSYCYKGDYYGDDEKPICVQTRKLNIDKDFNECDKDGDGGIDIKEFASCTRSGVQTKRDTKCNARDWTILEFVFDTGNWRTEGLKYVTKNECVKQERQKLFQMGFGDEDDPTGYAHAMVASAIGACARLWTDERILAPIKLTGTCDECLGELGHCIYKNCDFNCYNLFGMGCGKCVQNNCVKGGESPFVTCSGANMHSGSTAVQNALK